MMRMRLIIPQEFGSPLAVGRSEHLDTGPIQDSGLFTGTRLPRYRLRNASGGVIIRG